MSKPAGQWDLPLEAGACPVLDAETLYRLYGRRCYSLAWRILGAQDAAVDVVVDVFASAVKEPGRLESLGTCMSMRLLALTHDRAVDLVRQRRCEKSSQAAARDDGPLTAASQLGALCPTEMKVVAGAYYGGHTLPELAAQLNLPTHMVRRAALTGMQALRLHADDRGAVSPGP